MFRNLGPTARIAMGSSRRTSASPPSRSTFSCPRVRVEIVAGKASSAVIAIEQDIFRIGSNDANDLDLDDPTVSRFQCRIRRDGVGWRKDDS
jgi:pSer/pThr/pTyr-binding forkhead associated (FHA) protein